MRPARGLFQQFRFRRGAGDADPACAIDARAVAERMARSDFNAELFLRPELSSWRGDRQRLNKGDRWEAETDISGARFQAADPLGEDRSLERETQHDVVGLIDGVMELRRLPGLESLVLSEHDLKRSQPIRGKGTRVKFALRAARGAEDDRVAARRCHAAIRRAIRKSGLRVEHPRERFDPATGLRGLRAWGEVLRLKKRRLWPWWLLLLPLLLLVPTCETKDTFFGFSLEHRSLLVVVDKSGSMESVFPAVRAEAKRTLASLRRAGLFSGRAYADVIVYDEGATSALGGLREVTAETEAELNAFLDRLQAGGGTRLRPALDRAAAEIRAHGRPTTIVILTDAEGDPSIGQTVSGLDEFLQQFGDVEVVGHALTPRLIGGGGGGPPEPIGDERSLADLAAGLGGTFGPREDDS